LTERRDQSDTVAVLGAGSWGTALAVSLARKGIATRLWGRDPEQIVQMAQERRNSRYLPQIEFPTALSVEADIARAVADVSHVLLVVPSQGFRAALKLLEPHISTHTPVAWATKGLEPHTFKLLHVLVREELGTTRHTAVVSGPTFAREVAAGLPTAVTVASFDAGFAHAFARLLHSETFRAYTSTDVVGVEAGGAVKNVLAIAAGLADGMQLGANTRAALITRGLAEIQRLGVALGGHPETLMGLAGLGDLVLTCTDNQSRNRRVGLGLAQGLTIAEIQQDLGQVAEGIFTAQEVFNLAKQLGVDMPICREVYEVLYCNKSARDALHSLLSRRLKPETGVSNSELA